MNLAARQHPIETLVECLAPVPLAFAAAWSAQRLGLGFSAAAAVAIAGFTLGFGAMRRIGASSSAARYDFEPASIDSDLLASGELLLEAHDEVLMLDDPIAEVAEDSRVVRLFARQDPTPGELVNRITDFLGEERRAVTQPGGPADAAPPADASAALHAALANIRASLR